MKCPNCNHVSGAALAKYSNCGETYERDSLEQLGRHDFLLAWLDERAALVGGAYAQLRAEASEQLETIRRALLPSRPAEPITPVPPTLVRPDAEIAHEAALVAGLSQLVRGWYVA